MGAAFSIDSVSDLRQHLFWLTGDQALATDPDLACSFARLLP
jgi:hypothetical protein